MAAPVHIATEPLTTATPDAARPEFAGSGFRWLETLVEAHLDALVDPLVAAKVPQHHQLLRKMADGMLDHLVRELEVRGLSRVPARDVTDVAAAWREGSRRTDLTIHERFFSLEQTANHATNAYFAAKEEQERVTKLLTTVMVGAKVDYDALPYELGDDGCERLKRDGKYYILDAEAVKDLLDGSWDEHFTNLATMEYYRRTSDEWYFHAEQYRERARTLRAAIGEYTANGPHGRDDHNHDQCPLCKVMDATRDTLQPRFSDTHEKLAAELNDVGPILQPMLMELIRLRTERRAAIRQRAALEDELREFRRFDEHLKARVAELCPDYPSCPPTDMWDALWALSASYEGTDAACTGWQEKFHIMREALGLSREQAGESLCRMLDARGTTKTPETLAEIVAESEPDPTTLRAKLLTAFFDNTPFDKPISERKRNPPKEES